MNDDRDSEDRAPGDRKADWMAKPMSRQKWRTLTGIDVLENEKEVEARPGTQDLGTPPDLH